MLDTVDGLVENSTVGTNPKDQVGGLYIVRLWVNSLTYHHLASRRRFDHGVDLQRIAKLNAI